MPIISSFYGIIIRMYFNDTEQHHTPHFHASYAGEKAVFDLEGNLLAGSVPTKQNRLIIAWIEIHREELVALWEVMQNDEEYFKIKGLE